MNNQLEALHQKYGEEQVLCIPTEALAPFAIGTDPILYPTPRVMEIMEAQGVFKLRYQVELDAAWKQVIPYVVMQTEDQVMAAKRLKGDARLVGGYTIGMGGHINPADAAREMSALVEACIFRELEEETTFSRQENLVSYQLHEKSFVNVRNEVSLMHLCIPVWLTVRNAQNIQIREVEKLQGTWLPRAELHQLDGKLEGWSEIALDLLKNA